MRSARRSIRWFASIFEGRNVPCGWSMNEAIKEQLSAYVDGELPENEAELLIRRMSQDAELRQEVANYLAIGRVMRDEIGIAAADRLHERVAAGLGEAHDEAAPTDEAVAATRSLKPLAGVAIAASVALLAVFALQSTGVDEATGEGVATTANSAVPTTTLQEEIKQQYLRNHTDTSSQHGANGMGSRLVSLEIVGEDAGDAEAEDEEESAVQP